MIQTARRTLALLLGLAGISIAVTVNVAVEVHVRPSVPLADLGLSPDHTIQAAPVVAQMPTFFVVGADAQENRTKNVRLWEWAKLANNGQHLRNYPQEIGDCVSHGARNACEYFNAAGIGKGTLSSEYHELFPPWIYGGSRVTVGKGRLGRGDGSVGAWAAEFVQRYGVLRADLPNVPAYSGRVAKDWGWKGPPAEFFDHAKEFTFETVAPVRSAQDVCDAICNGYPVTIASDFGTRTIRPKDGRQVALRNSKWMHQMCIIGWDGSTNAGPWAYVLNSWGPDAHPKPLQGEPPGGFWIHSDDVEYIVRQGDSFAFSGFDGFPPQEFVPDFNVIGQANAAAADGVPVVQEGETMFPIPLEFQVPGTGIGLALIAMALVLWFWRGNRHGRVAIYLPVVVALASISMVANPATLSAQDWSRLVRAANSPTPTGDSLTRLPEFSRDATDADSDSVGAVDFDRLILAARAPDATTAKSLSLTTKDLASDAECPQIDFLRVIRAATAPTVPATPPGTNYEEAGRSDAGAAKPVAIPHPFRGGYPLRARWWSHPGPSTHENLVLHLSTGEHVGKFDSRWLATLSVAQLESLHSDDHEGRVDWTYAQRPPPVPQQAAQHAAQPAKATSRGRWETLKICRGGVCTTERVWIPSE